MRALRFWWQERRLYAALDRISESYKREMANARANSANAEALRKIEDSHHFEEELVEDELQTLVSSYYVRLASRLIVPVPEFTLEGGSWQRSQVSGAYTLTPKALHELRTAIRVEQKARREAWTVWLSLIVSLVVGVIGAITGLVSVWKN